MLVKQLIITAIVGILMLFISITCIGIASLSEFNPVTRSLNNFSITDLFYQIDYNEIARDTSDIITIVDMTDIYDRSRLADIIDSIKKMEPAVLGVDIEFIGLKGDTVGSERIAEVAADDDGGLPIFWSIQLTEWNNESGQYDSSQPSFFCDTIDVKEGFVNVARSDNGSTVRSFGVRRQCNGQTMFSLPAQLSAAFLNDSSILMGPADWNIEYSSTFIPTITVEELAEHPELIRSRIVLLGGINNGDDMHFTPLPHPVSGVMIIAFAIQSMINHSGYVEVKGWKLWGITFMLILFVGLFQNFVSEWFRNFKDSFFLQYMASSYFTYRLVDLFSCICLLFLSFLLFKEENILFNVGWTIMGVVLLAAAREIYNIIIHTINLKK